MIYELLFENSVQPSQKLVSATKPLSHGGKTSAHGPECMQTIAMCTAPKKVPFNKGLKIRLLEELVIILSIPVEQVICDNWDLTWLNCTRVTVTLQQIIQNANFARATHMWFFLGLQMYGFSFVCRRLCLHKSRKRRVRLCLGREC